MLDYGNYSQFLTDFGFPPASFMGLLACFHAKKNRRSRDWHDERRFDLTD